MDQLKRLEAAGMRFAEKREVVKSHEQLIKNLSEQIRSHTSKGDSKTDELDGKQKSIRLAELEFQKRSLAEKLKQMNLKAQI